MVDYEEVGKRIRYCRRRKGITQEQLAFEINTSAAYLSNIERAKKKPSLQKLIQIAEVLEVSIEELVSPSSDSINTSANVLGQIMQVDSDNDRKRLVKNLFEIINILQNSS